MAGFQVIDKVVVQSQGRYKGGGEKWWDSIYILFHSTYILEVEQMCWWTRCGLWEIDSRNIARVCMVGLCELVLPLLKQTLSAHLYEEGSLPPIRCTWVLDTTAGWEELRLGALVRHPWGGVKCSMLTQVLAWATGWLVVSSPSEGDHKRS